MFDTCIEWSPVQTRQTPSDSGTDCSSQWRSHSSWPKKIWQMEGIHLGHRYNRPEWLWTLLAGPLPARAPWSEFRWERCFLSVEIESAWPLRERCRPACHTRSGCSCSAGWDLFLSVSDTVASIESTDWFLVESHGRTARAWRKWHLLSSLSTEGSSGTWRRGFWEGRERGEDAAIDCNDSLRFWVTSGAAIEPQPPPFIQPWGQA